MSIELTADEQLASITRNIQEYMSIFFDPTDGYMDCVRDARIQATPQGVITLSDGRKFKVGLIPFTEELTNTE